MRSLLTIWLLIQVILFFGSCGSLKSGKIKYHKSDKIQSEISSTSIITKSASERKDEVLFVQKEENENLLASATNKTDEEVIFIKKKKSIDFVFNKECDIILKRDGSEIEAKVIEVGINEIKYKKCDNLAGPTYVLLKNDVFMINYPNGQKDIFKEKVVEASSLPPEKKVRGTKIHAGGVIALVLSIIALLGGLLIPWVTLFAIPALTIGIISLVQVSKHPEKYTGLTASILGIIFGSLGTGLLLFYIRFNDLF